MYVKIFEDGEWVNIPRIDRFPATWDYVYTGERATFYDIFDLDTGHTYPLEMRDYIKKFLHKNITSPEDAESIKEANRRRIREIIKSRCFPGVIVNSSRKPLCAAPDLREQAARETLRRVIGEDQWRRFIKNGFIQVRAKSGRYYQLFPGDGMTKVYENGEYVAKLCIILRGGFPATDSLIMRYLMVLNNEDDFWNRSVKHYVKGVQEVEDLWGRDFNFPEPPPEYDLTEMARLIRVA